MKAKWWVCILTAISDQLSGIKISNAFKSDSIYSVQNFIIENFLIDADRVQKQVWMEKKKTHTHTSIYGNGSNCICACVENIVILKRLDRWLAMWWLYTTYINFNLLEALIDCTFFWPFFAFHLAFFFSVESFSSIKERFYFNTPPLQI